jgi:hypothetical protein
MKLISIKKAKEIWEANDGNPGEALWVLSGEYNEDDEPLLTTIDPEDGFPEDEKLFFEPMEIMGINPDYLETHYVVSVFIDKNQDEIQSLLDIQFYSGTVCLWDKAESLTNEFQSKYDGTAWGEELDWHDTLDQFLIEKIK